MRRGHPALADAGGICVSGIVYDQVASPLDLRWGVSRNATTRYTSAPDVAAVGRELGVRYVVSGTVRRHGSRLRAGTELADTATGAILSTRRIDGGPDDVFRLHDRIATAAVAALAPHVREAEIRRTSRPVTRPPVRHVVVVEGGAG